MSFKVCPNCSLQARPDAAQCLQCGHRFTMPDGSPVAPPPIKVKPAFPPVLIGVGALVAAIVTMVCWAFLLNASSSPAMSTSQILRLASPGRRWSDVRDRINAEYRGDAEGPYGQVRFYRVLRPEGVILIEISPVDGMIYRTDLTPWPGREP